MGLFRHITEGILMTIIGYIGIFSLTAIGVNFGPWIFTTVGLLATSTLAMMYTFYFRL